MPSTTYSRKKGKSRLGRGLNSLFGVEKESQSSKRVAKKTGTKKTSSLQKKELLNKKAKTAKEVMSPWSKVDDEERIHKIFVEQLQPHRHQPRQIFDEATLEELTKSIKEKGIMQPIVAQKLADKNFEIIAGERRWRAAQRAGLKHIPVILRQVDPQESLELALIENIQRDNLNAIEEAEAYNLLADKYKLTQSEIAQKVGKDRATITNTLRLLKLSKTVQDYVSKGQLSMGHARALITVEDKSLQKKLAKKCIDLTLSVRAAEKLVKNVLEGKEPESLEGTREQKAIQSLTEEIQKLSGAKAKISYKNGRGSIMLKFYSKDQFEGLIKNFRTWSGR